MNYVNKVLLAAVFSIQNVSATEPAAKAPEPKSEYETNLVSLKDLTGVYVVLEFVTKSSEKSHLSVNPDLQQEVKKRLESVGLKLLSKEEMLKTPGNPELDIYPNYPAHLSGGSPEAGAAPVVANLTPTNQCCYTSIWGSFLQGAVLERKGNTKYRLGTWGSGSNTDSCEKLGDWMSEATLKIIDNFVADYKKAQDIKIQPQAKNQTEQKTVVSATELTRLPKAQVVQVKEIDDTKGMACDTAFMVYAQIFKTGSTTISSTKNALLDKLATHMLACQNYRYRIETRPDKGGNHDAKELLSARRAISLHNYLIGKGIDKEQFEMRFFDNDKSSNDKTEEDVVITPISSQ
jgi:outer membrane protein OmpA-like peptidoglycan-associated protein